MLALVQRVSSASVRVEGELVGSIERGVLVLLGVVTGDTRVEGDWLAAKVSRLRIFPDDDGKMNRSLQDIGGSALVVSQFTLAGDTRKGTRPSYIASGDSSNTLISLRDSSSMMIDALVGNTTGDKCKHCLAKEGQIYLVYLAYEQSTSIRNRMPRLRNLYR